MAERIVTQDQACVLPSQLERRWQKGFRERMRDVPREKWRCVGIDIGKYEHVAVVQDGNGTLLARPLRFGIQKAEVWRLWDVVDSLLGEPVIKPVFAMEPSGHYYEPLAHAISQSCEGRNDTTRRNLVYSVLSKGFRFEPVVMRARLFCLGAVVFLAMERCGN